MDTVQAWLDTVSGFLWGPFFLIPLLVGTGVFISFRMGFVQLFGLRHAFALISGRYEKHDDPGEITHFQALSAALSATAWPGIR
jgi:alanine or glycine:cation symporter, AGCS family